MTLDKQKDQHHSSTMTSMNAHLSHPISCVIMVSLTFGVCVTTFPYVVETLGPVTFLVILTYFVGLLCFYALLQKESSVKVMSIVEEQEMLNNPYMVIADVTLGTKYNLFVRFIFYAYLVTQTIAFQLAAATVLTNFISMNVSYFLEIRIWLCVCLLISLPIMLKETFNDMVVPAVITLSTSFVAVVCISTTSLIARFYYNVLPTQTFLKTDRTPVKSFFVAFGVILFAATGIPSVIPNIVVLLESTEHFNKSIYFSYLVLFVGYLICAMIPYSVFGAKINPNIIATLYEFLPTTKGSWLCHLLVVVAQLCLTAHFTLVAVLQINPVYLSLEHILNVPKRFTWKRFVLRTLFLLGMLLVCLIMPHFKPILSLFGSGPIFVYIVLFYTLFYWKLVPSTNCMKFLLVVFFGIILIFCTGTTIYSIVDLIDAFHSDGVWSLK